MEIREFSDSSLETRWLLVSRPFALTLVALVVVGILFRRKLLTKQSLSAPSGKNSKEESIEQGEKN